MYSVFVTVQVTPGMLAEYDAYSERFFAHCKQVRGVVSVFQDEDLSHPGRYSVSVNFEGREAYGTWARSPELKAIIAEAGPSLFTIVGDVEAWRTVAIATPGASAPPAYHVISLYTVNANTGTRELVEATGREAVTAFERHGRGLVHAALIRLAGSVTRYGFVTAFISPADAAATFAQPAIVRLGQDDSLRPYLVGEMDVRLQAIVRSFVAQPAALR
jgi:quinol monooxygenase YgiN